ncbi:MAG: hypothetical protein K6G63_10775 [Eubacterium sp.]|nr:hypothetical protein [Eubacterium sp.]
MRKTKSCLMAGVLALALGVGTVGGFGANISQAAKSAYSVCTDKSTKEVESFAKEVKKAVMNDDWKTLADKISYPIKIYDQNIKNKKAFIKKMNNSDLEEQFFQEIGKEDCKKMFSNWRGIMMGNGEIWIGEVNKELKVISINSPFSSKTIGKPGKIKWSKPSKKDSDAVGIKASWKKVKGAQGYQAKFFLFWPSNKKDSVKKNVKKPSATVYFQDNKGIKVKVRAYKLVDGEKVYGKWTKAKLTAAQAKKYIG